MAEVWLAEDAEGRRAALKWMREAALPLAARFAAEIEALSRMEHPGIIHLLASGHTDGRPWLAMNVVDGPDLAALGERLRGRPVVERHERTREIGLQLADALGYLHRSGLVHRDVKPANILWASGRAVLADFGVVAAVGAPPDPGFVGSPAWAAPEALLGESVGPRADQYGFGLVLYWLVTAQRPFEDGRRYTPRVAPKAPSLRDPTVPADLEAVILRCLAPDPAGRFPDMEAVADALRALPRSEASRVAGRQPAADRVAVALDDVAAGRGRVVRLAGAPGSGQAWLARLAREAAGRRGLVCVATDDPDAARRAAARVAAGEACLVITQAELAADETILLAPLGVADLRRSIFAVAAATPDLAAAAERLRAWSGGHVDLIETALAIGVVDGCFDLSRVAPPDLAPWLDGLDLDAESVAQALAVLPTACPASDVEAVAAAPAPETLPLLEQRGLAERVGNRWLLAAECFRGPLCDRAIDLDGLRERAASVVGIRVEDDPVLREARAHVEAGRLEAAIHTLVDVVDAVAQPDRTTAERRLLLAALHWTLRDTVGAARQWRAVRREALDPRLRARASIGLGALHLQAGELDPALDALHHALTDADLAHDARIAALASMNLAEARALRGQLPDALRAGRRAREEARALRDSALEAKTARALGQVLADMGMYAEAEATLADASALARATGLDEERLAAHALRAQVALDARPGDRTAAAVALDRLFTTRPGMPDPEGFGALAAAIRAEAQARLGETTRSWDALRIAEQAGVAPAMAVRVRLRSARALVSLGAADRAREELRRAVADATTAGFVLAAWRARCDLARLDGAALPEPGALLDGLDDAQRKALLPG